MYDSKLIGNGMPTNLVPCLHPISTIVNGEKVLVPCGHCSKCTSTRLNIQVGLTNRLFSIFRFCILVTLTYDEEHVPKFTIEYNETDGKNYVLFLNREIKSTDPLSDVSVLTDDEVDSIHEIWNNSKYNYRSTDYIRYIHKEDYQLYIKRVKRYVKQYFPGTICTYVGCTEYGERFLRPHFHVLFFCDNSRAFFGMLKYFKENKTADSSDRSVRWPYGRVDARAVHDANVGSYVSSYVSSSSTTPEILRRKEFRGKFFHGQTAGFFPIKDVAEKVRTLPPAAFAGHVVHDTADDTERLRLWSDFNKLYRRFSDIDYIRNYGFTSFLAACKSMLDDCEAKGEPLSRYCKYVARNICFDLSHHVKDNYYNVPLLSTYFTQRISLTFLASYAHAFFEKTAQDAFDSLFARIYHTLLVYRHFRAFTLVGCNYDEISQVKKMYENCEQITASYRLYGQYAKLQQLDRPELVDNYFRYYKDMDLSVFDDSQVFISYFDNLIAKKDKTKKINEPTLFNN